MSARPLVSIHEMHSNPPSIPNLDVAGAAQSYSLFGGVLFGFALISLFSYLTEKRKRDREGQGLGQHELPPGTPIPIETRHVTRTVFYATASLVMTSFLYANLAGEPVPRPGSPVRGEPAVAPAAWAIVALLSYGVAFGLAVLMLFYALTLVMLERGLVPEAEWAYWVVACAGPAVVLRFLLGVAAAARWAISGHPPGGPVLSRPAQFAWVLGTAVLSAALMLIGLRRPWWLRWARDRLGNRPALPALGVFVGVALMTGLLSVYFTGRSSAQRPPSSLAVAILQWSAVVAVWLFALACGCVIGPRVPVSLTRIRNRRSLRKKERLAFEEGAIPARWGLMRSGKGVPEKTFTVYLTNPSARHTARTPKLPWVLDLRQYILAHQNRTPTSSDGKLRTVLDLLDQDDKAQLDELRVTAEWEHLEHRWPPLTKIRLQFGVVRTDSASIILNWVIAGSPAWICLENCAQITLTTKKYLRGVRWSRRGRWTDVCIPIGPAHRSGSRPGRPHLGATGPVAADSHLIGAGQDAERRVGPDRGAPLAELMTLSAPNSPGSFTPSIGHPATCAQDQQAPSNT